MNSTTALDRPPAPGPRRRTAWWTSLGLLLVTLVAATVLLALALQSAPLPPIGVTIDGEQVLHGVDLAQLSPADKLLLAGALLCTLLAVLVVVPVTVVVALVAALGAVVVAILLVVGLPLLLVGLVAALLLSPLLLLGWLVWTLVRG